MVNINKLKGKIVECGMNVEILAEKIGMNKSTLYRKLSSTDDVFTIREADLIARELKLTYSEINAIFFSQIVA
ncbi:MAG: XRE family transcriptional regulator [Lachnospiraceae bacterium]